MIAEITCCVLEWHLMLKGHSEEGRKMFPLTTFTCILEVHVKHDGQARNRDLIHNYIENDLY